MMSIKPKILIASVAGLLVMSGSIYAAVKNPRIFINGVEFASSALNLKMENGTAMVSLKSIVDELRGKVVYKDNVFYITMPEASELQMQITSLEYGLQAYTPEDAVQTWIRGVQRRSGGMQYAVLSPKLRDQTKQEFIANFWVTGVSSPHMGKVDALQTKTISPDQVQISFNYPLVAQDQVIGTGSAVLTVDKIKRESFAYWAISRIALKDPGDTGVMIGAVKLE
ncbi:hypothetical protein [Paenibacillus guangzhouensis]|uniref:hypothetical protein n=1 Tax=Paenibacillus guangzhouensis TaxID=1473112 RepID=UPI0012673877|nr:hypothetical protein [Paenibacillus guangzhouensis]